MKSTPLGMATLINSCDCNGLNSLICRAFSLSAGSPGFNPQLPNHTRDGLKIVPVAPMIGAQHLKGQFVEHSL